MIKLRKNTHKILTDVDMKKRDVPGGPWKMNQPDMTHMYQPDPTETNNFTDKTIPEEKTNAKGPKKR